MTARRRGPILALALPIACFPGLMAGCAFLGAVAGVQATDTKEKTFPVATAPVVTVETFNGEVTVSRGEPGEVAVTVYRKARAGSPEEAERRLEEILVTTEQEGDSIRIVARPKGKSSTGLGAGITLKVPEGADLRIDAGNGAIGVLGVGGPVVAETSNGQITVNGARGTLDLDTSNGAVDIVADDVAVDVETSNGAITFEGRPAAGPHRFETSNGAVTLVLPADAAFELDAETSNGKVTSDFEGLGEPARTVKGRVGEAPEASIRVRTSNGGIDIRKR